MITPCNIFVIGLADLWPLMNTRHISWWYYIPRSTWVDTVMIIIIILMNMMTMWWWQWQWRRQWWWWWWWWWWRDHGDADDDHDDDNDEIMMVRSWWWCWWWWWWWWLLLLWLKVWSSVRVGRNMFDQRDPTFMSHPHHAPVSACLPNV